MFTGIDDNLQVWASVVVLVDPKCLKSILFNILIQIFYSIFFSFFFYHADIK
jgi:hypothetical protein